MKTETTLIALSLAVVVLAAGCSKSAPNAGAAATTGEQAGKVALANAVENANKGGLPTPCEKDFGASDAAQILTGSTALNRYAMNNSLGGKKEDGCEMGDATGALIDFSIHDKPPITGNGDTKQWYESMVKMRSNPKGIPLSGVGDEAVWFGVQDSNIPGMNEFDTLAIKGKLLCMADLHFRKGPVGEKAIAPARGEELAKKLGALCSKVFAARG